MPPLPAPTTGWKRVTWASRDDAYGEPDFDLLLNEMLALWSPAQDDPAALLHELVAGCGATASAGCR